MAVSTKVVDTARVPGSRRQTVSEVTLDNSYLENGESLTAAELGLKTVIWAFCTILSGTEAEASPILTCKYNASKELIEAISAKTQKPMESAKDLSKVVVQVVAYGV